MSASITPNHGSPLRRPVFPKSLELRFGTLRLRASIKPEYPDRVVGRRPWGTGRGQERVRW